MLAEPIDPVRPGPVGWHLYGADGSARVAQALLWPDQEMP